MEEVASKELELVKFQPKRTFGIELEFNNCGGSGDTRVFLKRCLEQVGEPAVISDWTHNNNNSDWICKTDSSCGFEIASKVMGSNKSIRQTLTDLKTVEKVIQHLKESGARFDQRCGLHCHVYVGDLPETSLFKLLSTWVRCEKTILDMMPSHRKNNSFCTSHHGFFRAFAKFNYRDLLSMGFHHRGALNMGHYNSRKTIEFRIFEMSLDAHNVKNWIRFLLHFIESAATFPEAENLHWMTLPEVLSVLHLHNDEKEGKFKVLSPALMEMKVWLLNRIYQHAGFRDADQIKGEVKKMAEELA